MLFNSFSFLIFFTILCGIYFSIDDKYRRYFLLGASYYFYMCWKAEYIILIIASTLIDYFAGLKMANIKERHKRKKYLILSIGVNIGLLFAFKYFNFFNSSLKSVFNQLNIFYGVPVFKMLLPVGISFYTFQTLSYSIDVYYGKRGAERNLSIFALYVAFFPQLVAGPIERSTHLMPQFYRKFTFNYKRTTDGLKLMAWGFFKKIFIADRLAIFVNSVYNDPHQYRGLTLMVATVFFAYQIYCDFSGYTDIARGAAKVLGYDIMRNFDRPYSARSIKEFWHRWHISLTTWFRDYVYIPLGGNRRGLRRWHINVFIVFLLSGLWHGANWTFIAWGCLHGAYFLISIWTKKIRQRAVAVIKLDSLPWLMTFLQISITFILVNFAWILFRANNLTDALYIYQNLFSGLSEISTIDGIKNSLGGFGLSDLEFIIAIMSILIMEIIQFIQTKRSPLDIISDWPIVLRWGLYYALVACILFFGVIGEKAFIYFQF
jgi:alginate O-acetyltransferase complex protein AlgI